MIEANKVKAGNDNEVVIIKISGDIDLVQALEIEKLIDINIENGIISFIFNLEKANYITSVGLRVFIETYKHLMTLKGRMMLINISNSIKKTLEITELLDFFEIIDSLENALKSFIS